MDARHTTFQEMARLLRKLRHGECPVLLRPPGRQRSEARHEEVKPREGHQVHGDLTQVTVQLPWEAQAACDATHGRRHQVIQVPIGRCRQLQRSEADVIQGLFYVELSFHVAEFAHLTSPA